jgi:hypothetical protein
MTNHVFSLKAICINKVLNGPPDWGEFPGELITELEVARLLPNELIYELEAAQRCVFCQALWPCGSELEAHEAACSEKKAFRCCKKMRGATGWRLDLSDNLVLWTGAGMLREKLTQSIGQYLRAGSVPYRDELELRDRLPWCLRTAAREGWVETREDLPRRGIKVTIQE